jgi:hypothetical protein
MFIPRLPYQLEQIDDVVLFDDFEKGLDTTNGWNTVLSASVTAVAAAGVVALTDAATTANDEAYLFSRQALFQPGPGKNMCAETYLQYTEQNGALNNVAFGIMSGVATGALVTAGGGIRATGTFIGIYKKSGDVCWRAHAQNPAGASAAQDDLSTSPCGLSTYTRLGIEVMAQQGTYAEIAYRVDGVLLVSGTDPSRVIKHTLDLTSLSAAQLCVLMRSGTTATVAEAVNVDYLSANIKRGSVPQ